MLTEQEKRGEENFSLDDDMVVLGGRHDNNPNLFSSTTQASKPASKEEVNPLFRISPVVAREVKNL